MILMSWTFSKAQIADDAYALSSVRSVATAVLSDNTPIAQRVKNCGFVRWQLDVLQNLEKVAYR
jgi:hypothetical protein